MSGLCLPTLVMGPSPYNVDVNVNQLYVSPIIATAARMGRYEENVHEP